MQSELKAATAQLGQLLEKQAAGQALTAKDQQQAAQAQRKIDAVRDMMKAQDWDPLTVTPALAEAQKATDAEVVELRQKVAELEQRFGTQSQAAEQARVAAERAAVQQLYKGVDVDAVWNKSLADAAQQLGLDAAKVQPDSTEGRLLGNLANNTFHSRAGQAAKSLAGRAAVTPAAAAAAAAAKTGKPATAAGGRVQAAAPAVTNNGGTVQLDPMEQYRRDAVALVKD